MPTVTQRYATSLPHSVEDVWAWHARPGAFARLAPPWEDMTFVDGDQGLDVGAQTVFRIKKAGVPITWEALHTVCEPPNLFVDEQQKGPFAAWRHEHHFQPTEAGGCRMEDAITWTPPGGPFGAVAVPSLKGVNDRMFRYRHRRTRQDLARHAAYADRPRLRIAITGATGLVGSALAAFLTTGGHEVVRVTRRKREHGDCVWDVKAGTIDLEALQGVDAVVHLAGAPVSERWTDAHKQAIRESRVDGTRLIVEAIGQLDPKPRVLVSASAIGRYGPSDDRELTEDSPAGDDFLSEVATAWEAEAEAVRAHGTRLVIPRIGIVTTAAGAALATMLPLFRAGAGGPIGTGDQWISWISLDDLVALLHGALFEEDWSGPVNAVAPNPLPQKEQARVLGQVLGRPAIVPTPAAAIRTALGEMGEVLVLGGQRVVPARAQEWGFRFEHTDYADAVRATLGLA